MNTDNQGQPYVEYKGSRITFVPRGRNGRGDKDWSGGPELPTESYDDSRTIIGLLAKVVAESHKIFGLILTIFAFFLASLSYGAVEGNSDDVPPRNDKIENIAEMKDGSADKTIETTTPFETETHNSEANGDESDSNTESEPLLDAKGQIGIILLFFALFGALIIFLSVIGMRGCGLLFASNLDFSPAKHPILYVLFFPIWTIAGLFALTQIKKIFGGD